MIRLVVALLVTLALHPAGVAAARARAHGHDQACGHERALVAGGGRHVAPALVDARLVATPPALAPRLGPLAFVVAGAAAPGSFVAVARLWLRAQRLLC